jgi:hypothetical protein
MSLAGELSRRITRLAAGRRLPRRLAAGRRLLRRTVRVRLTLVYDGLFLLSGAALVATT